MATVRGAGADARYKITAAPERDDWDRWNSERDRMIRNAMPGITRINTTSDRKIWTPTDVGRTRPTTVRYGCRMSRMAGLRIAMAIGFGSLTTVGHGWAMSCGAGRHITMGAGCITAIRGMVAGTGVGRGLLPSLLGASLCFVLWIRRRLGFVSDLGGAAGAVLAGCRSGRVTASSHGGADMAVGSGMWASTALVGLAGLADSEPLHGGTQFSNLAHISDPHVGGALSTVGAGRFARDEPRRWRRLMRS